MIDVFTTSTRALDRWQGMAETWLLEHEQVAEGRGDSVLVQCRTIKFQRWHSNMQNAASRRQRGRWLHPVSRGCAVMPGDATASRAWTAQSRGIGVQSRPRTADTCLAQASLGSQSRPALHGRQCGTTLHTAARYRFGTPTADASILALMAPLRWALRRFEFLKMGSLS